MRNLEQITPEQQLQEFHLLKDLQKTNFHSNPQALRGIFNQYKFLEDGRLNYDIKAVNGLTFFTDPEKPVLKQGENAIYPYSDEADDLFLLASSIYQNNRQPFDVVIDPFCGDGKSALPLVANGIAKEVWGSDINPRTIHIAHANMELNRLGNKGVFFTGDIRKRLVRAFNPNNTILFIANPPFALKAKGADMDRMRDGGENGLALTMAYAKKAIQQARTGDVIIGVAYSRIQPDGTIELQKELDTLIDQHRGTLTISLVQGKALWRGHNGKKEQPNPMVITPEIFALKAKPGDQTEIDAYRTAAQMHNEAGFSHLGYFSYIVRM